MKSFLKKVIWLIMAAPLALLLILWNEFPSRIAMHYDLEGNPDRYGDKKELIILSLIMIAMNVFVYFLLTNIYRIDPKKYAAENKERLHSMALAVSIFLSFLLCIIIYSSLDGNIKFSMGIIFAGIGLLFAVIGNYMPNLKPNYFAGLRLPWTLENEENWRKTHRLGGRLFFWGGLILGAACLFLPSIAAIVVFFSGTMIIVIITCVYSYRLYKKQKLTGNLNGH